MRVPASRGSHSFALGALYEDCAYHPCLCTLVRDGRELEGISLIDGSAPRGCSVEHCGPEPLSVAQAVVIKRHHQRYAELRARGLSIRGAIDELAGPSR